MGFYLQGLTMGLAYVAPIGMQNLFVINSALTKTRRKAVFTAIIVTIFDVALSLSCFFGVAAAGRVGCGRCGGNPHWIGADLSGIVPPWQRLDIPQHRIDH